MKSAKRAVKARPRTTSPNGQGGVTYIKADRRWSRSADDAIDYAERHPIEWIAKPLLAIGQVSLFAGKAKAGKTTFIFKTVKEMADGGQILGFTVDKARVLIWSERSVQVNGERFKVLLGESRAHVHLVTRFDEELEGLNFERALSKVMTEARNQKCRVVVVDTLSALAQVEDENDAAVMQRCLTLLAHAAQNYQMAVAVIHHLSAGGRIRGSTTLEADPATLVEIAGEYQNPRTLKVRSGLISRTPDPITFKLNDHDEYEIVDEIEMEEAQEVLDVLSVKQAEAKTATEILGALGRENTDAERMKLTRELKALRKRGSVSDHDVLRDGHTRTGWNRIAPVTVVRV